MDSVTQNGYSNSHAFGVSLVIDAYTPKGIDRWIWLEVRDTVTQIVRAAKPFSADEARAALRSVTRLTVWSHQELGFELDPSLILHASSIERFISITMADVSAPSQRRESQRLLAIAAAVHRTTTVPSRRTGRLARSSQYSSKAIAGIIGWAASQSSERLRANAELVIGMAFGAGLTAAEILLIRAGNIVELDGLLIVTVPGENPRQVPVRRFWASLIRERVLSRLSKDLLIQSDQLERSTTSLMTIFHGSGQAHRPDPQKMRSTWIIALLNERLPVPAVLAAAGLKHSGSLNRYLPFVNVDTDMVSLTAGEVSLGE